MIMYSAGGGVGKRRLVYYAVYSAAGVQFALLVVGGIVLGRYLDAVLDTYPMLIILGLIVGFLVGVRNLLRAVRFLNKNG